MSQILENPEQLAHMEKMASLGSLTAGIAHELNNPINFVSSNIAPLRRDIEDLLDILERYCSLSPKDGRLAEKIAEIEDMRDELDLDYIVDEIYQLLDSIADGAERTATIVKDLKNYSRIDKNEYRLSDIHEGIESTLTLLFNQVKNNIKIEKNYQDIPEIECLPGQLNQVWMNISANAIQAMHSGGTLRVTTSHDDDYVYVTLADNGVGMSDEVKDRIFEAFFTTKDIGEGTGLGMSISASIIEKHHGEISLESEEGKGTSFTIKLPIQQPDSEE